MSARWLGVPERGGALALELMLRIALLAGRGAARMLVYPVTAYFLAVCHEQRRASRAYLRRVLGREPLWRDVARHFHCFGTTLLDRVYLARDETARFDMRVHGDDIVTEKLRTGVGCLLLGAHLGSFEAMRALAAMHPDVRLKMLMYRHQSPALTRILEAQNPRLRDMVIPLGGLDTLITVRDCLARGEMVGMLGDRVAESAKVVRCTFLGDETLFPSGPMWLAARLGAPVVLFFAPYRGGNRYELHFELLAERVALSAERKDDDLRRWTQRYVDRLEAHARAAPFNWFNFYDYWDELAARG